VSRLNHLADEICAGAEVYFTGRQGGQYLKTAFILCDDYTELGSKLFLIERTQGWSDISGGRFKSYHRVMQDVVNACADVKDLCERMKERRDRRNGFFHSAQLLDLSVTTRMCVEAFCDLFDYCELLFDDQWRVAVSGARNLETLAILFQLESLAFSDPNMNRRIGEVIENWPRNAKSKKQTGVHIAQYPEDLHLRLCVISGGQLLHAKLRELLSGASQSG
jgi:hypothetical protein